MHYELWLDESGDFKSDLNNDEYPPSIVGGILIPVGIFNKHNAMNILEKAREGTPETRKKWVHGTDMQSKYYGKISTSALQMIKELGGQFVIFENKECVKIVNSDLTYLHILSEGIIQLFQTLSLEHDEIQLDIYAARRVKTDHKDFIEKQRIYIIQPDEYRERLQEKLDLGYARRSIRPNTNKWSWELKTASARVDERLMVADIVCHSWFRQHDERKFSDRERAQLHTLFNQRFIFTAVESSTVASMQRHLSEGAIGEALYEWILAEEEWQEQKETPEEILALILKRLKQLPDYVRQTQLVTVLNHLKTLIQLERKFEKAKRYLLKIQDEVIPQMQKEQMNHYDFFFDVHLMLFTNATHQGDIQLSEKQMQYCRNYLAKLTQRWESFGAVLDYFVRESIHLMNNYDFTGVKNKMDQLENLLENTIELFPLALQDELQMDIENMNADIYGKVLGTRLQAHLFLSRENKQHLTFARADSELALKQFTTVSDVKRQYQYRSQLECEAGNFDASLEWLGKSVGATENFTATNVMEHILQADQSMKIFGVMHYARLMAEACVQQNLSIANDMYEAWKQANVEQEILQQYPPQHPYQIILWKLATYLIVTGSTNAAMKRYSEAEAICLENKQNWTLFSISLAMKAEEAYFLAKASKNKERKQAEKRLKKLYTDLMNEPLLDSMRQFFASWGDVLASDAIDEEALFALSRKIAY